LSKRRLDIEALFTSSKTLEPRLKEVTFGKYKIRTIPTAKESLNDTSESFLLKFQDVWKEEQIASNPETECNYVLAVLSLMLEMSVEFGSIKIDNIQGTLRKKRSSFLMGNIELPSDLEDLFKKLQSMDMNLLRQYLRSCNAYKTALSLIDGNPMLSFFLLVTAIEAISGIVMKKKGNRANFREFILAYLPKSFEDELGCKELLLSLIERAYDVRNAFTHGGRGLSGGVFVADRLKRNYVKHKEKSKEVYSPSTKWMGSVVRAVLLEFLRHQKVGDVQESKLSEIAMEEVAINLIAARTVKGGQLVTSEDFDLDFRRTPER
jgi:hypothetical protein